MRRAVAAAAAALGWLPAPVLAVLGWKLGLLAMLFAGRRRRIVRRNLQLCFGARGALWRMSVAVGHFATLGRFLLDHALLLGASGARLRRLVKVAGDHHLAAVGDRPVILLAPHFVGLEHGAVRLGMDREMTALYTPQKSALADMLIYRARTRLAPGLKLVSNREPAIAKVVADLRAGRLLYYLNDMDQRAKGRNVFVPFLGMDKAATLTTLPRLARLTGAAVLPCATVARPLGGYQVTIGEPWQDFPSGDDEADMRRFNEFVGRQVAAHPTQYYWPHRRFKTQPPGQPDPYR